jgi:hypothetical protein
MPVVMLDAQRLSWPSRSVVSTKWILHLQTLAIEGVFVGFINILAATAACGFWISAELTSFTAFHHASLRVRASDTVVVQELGVSLKLNS